MAGVTTLDSDCTAEDTTITVVSESQLTENELLLIDDEIVIATAFPGEGQVDVTRAVDQTEAAAHLEDAEVYPVVHVSHGGTGINVYYKDSSGAVLIRNIVTLVPAIGNVRILGEPSGAGESLVTLSETEADWEVPGSSMLRMLTGVGVPVDPVNTNFSMGLIGPPNTSGDFRLEHPPGSGHKTAPLPFDVTGDEVAAAISTLPSIGAGNCISDPGYGSDTLADGIYLIFTGALQGQNIATPAVTDDTTDGGVQASDGNFGSASPMIPDAQPGDTYLDTTHSPAIPYLLTTPDGLSSWLLYGPLHYRASESGVTIVVPDDGVIEIHAPGDSGTIDITSNYNQMSVEGGDYPLIINDDNGYLLEQLPTVDPHHAGALWNDNGTLKVSS